MGTSYSCAPVAVASTAAVEEVAEDELKAGYIGSCYDEIGSWNAEGALWDDV